jgi:hypothetical protein
LEQSDRAVLPLSQPAPQLQPSPLDALLQSAAERVADPAVERWLRALLNTDQRGEGVGPD